MIPRLTNGFGKMADADLEIKTQSIIAAMTGNAYFPTPAPALSEMSTALDEYSAALSASQTGNRFDIADRKEKKAALVDLLHLLSSYVTFTAAGSIPALVSSGFTLAKERGGIKVVPKPGAVVLSDGLNAGELLASIARVPGANNYSYEYTPDPLTPESNWTGRIYSKKKWLFQGLESGKKYWVRVAAIGSQGQVVYSDAVCRTVQ